MRERRPSSIAQPGMTAWGRAAERDLDVYVRDTALRVPLEFPDRVMAAIEAETPSRHHRSLALSWSVDRARFRIAGGLVAMLVAMLGGAALVVGASGLLGRDPIAPTYPTPAGQPIIVAEPTATPTANIDDRTTEPAEATDPARSPAPNGPDGAKATPDSDPAAPTTEPGATDESDQTDESEATDHHADGGGDAGDPAETDAPDDGGSTGGTGGGGDNEVPDDSNAS